MRKLTILSFALLIGACTGDAVELTTTTTLDPELLAPPPSTAPPATDAPATTPETPPPGEPVEDYEIISRQSGEDGETLFVLVPPGEYTDIDIENFLGDLVEDDPAIFGVEIFSDRAALDAALRPEDDRSAAGLQAIEDHHLVSLTDGLVVTFRGPLEDYGEFVLGS